MAADLQLDINIPNGSDVHDLSISYLNHAKIEIVTQLDNNTVARPIKAGPFGGHGGSHFDMGAADRLLEIYIGYGSAVYGMNITYEKNGHAELAKFGDVPLGSQTAEIKFKRADFLKEISGYFGLHEGAVVVRSLTFDTNHGRYGPYGKEEGTRFSVPVANGKIIGFFGPAGNSIINAVGVYVAPNKH